jgi:hypothetical protein
VKKNNYLSTIERREVLEYVIDKLFQERENGTNGLCYLIGSAIQYYYGTNVCTVIDYYPEFTYDNAIAFNAKKTSDDCWWKCEAGQYNWKDRINFCRFLRNNLVGD